MRFKINHILTGILWGVILFQFPGCGNNISKEGKVIFTLAPLQVVSISDINSNNFRYAKDLKIAMTDQDNAQHSMEILSEDFYSARAPEISFDATQMVFTGQRNEGDVWQIWKMDLKSGDIIQVTSCENNCTDPAWLPDGRIVFSKLIDEYGLNHHALFSIAADGCCEQRLSFQPHDDLNATVLHDGRILFCSQQLYPVPGNTKYLVMRPDGTKAELFYLSENNAEISQVAETQNDVLFAEEGKLMSVKFSRPLHTVNSFGGLRDILIQAVFPVDDQHIMASVKKQTGNAFGIVSMNLEDHQLQDFYFDGADFNALEPVLIKNRELPRKLPSRIDSEKETGYFVCMNADKSEMTPHFVNGQTVRVQVLGIQEILGETDVAEDGSFYLELEADEPIRFQTLDNNGAVVRGPSSWMWVRPNERRGCVGCHEDREMAPENLVPKAIEKAPIAMIK